MAPNGASWSIKVQSLHLPTSRCLTKSNFIMMVGLTAFVSVICSVSPVLNCSVFHFFCRQVDETRRSR